jgi:hypothetical protein
MRDFDTATIRDDLQRLRIAAPEIFGANCDSTVLSVRAMPFTVFSFGPCGGSW